MPSRRRRRQVVGAAAIVDRGGDPARLDLPLHALVQLQVPTYQPDECPLCAAGLPSSSRDRGLNVPRALTRHGARRTCTSTSWLTSGFARRDAHPQTHPPVRRHGLRRLAAAAERRLDSAAARGRAGADRAPVPPSHGAGRTDAGVHAMAQVASATVVNELEGPTLARALNAVLPRDVRVLTVEEMPAGSTPDSRALQTYEYRIVNAPLVSAFLHRYVWHVPQPLDAEAMRTAAGLLVGRHDFAGFQGTGTPVASTERTILALDVEDGGGYDLPLVIRVTRRWIPAPHGQEHRRHAGRGRGRAMGPVAAPGRARFPGPVGGRPHGAAAGSFSDACGVLTSTPSSSRLPTSKSASKSITRSADLDSTVERPWSLGLELGVDMITVAHGP